MIKRIIYCISLLFVYCEITVADNYAILISAGEANSDSTLYNSEYWYDLYLTYEYLLLDEQYDSSKVFVFYGDGNDYNTGNLRYRKDLHNWGQIADYDNYYSTLYSVFCSLNNIIEDEDNLLIYWVAGHGTKTDISNDDSYLVRLSHNGSHEDLTKTQLINLINTISHYNKRKILWMTCYSGAMGGGYYNVNNNRTTLISSSASSEKSYSSTYYANNEIHTDFGYALYCISATRYPNGNPCDLNQYCQAASLIDSLLSMNELHAGISSFINLNTNMSLHPQHTGLFDVGCISNKIFLGEDKKLKNVTIDGNSSYWLDKMELMDVVFDSNVEVSIDIDIQSTIKRNIFVPLSTNLIVK